MPEEFGTAIARRLAGLPDASRDFAEVVAVSGRALAVREARQLVGEPGGSGRGGPLAAALGSGLVIVADRTVMPRHDLVREAVLAAMPDRTVRTLHRRFAEHHPGAGQALPAAPRARAAATRGDVAGALILITAAEQPATAGPQDAGDLAVLAFRTMLPEQTERLDVGRRCLSLL
ncbi:hypothetical protein [Streptomyces sp. AB3(2024)]|uniref:hypothetical protein n=1 Tax=Streptomyces sp. AB3(2024) TaxID=3317321 RepID=UPI0035A34DB2